MYVRSRGARVTEALDQSVTHVICSPSEASQAMLAQARREHTPPRFDWSKLHVVLTPWMTRCATLGHVAAIEEQHIVHVT